MCEDTLAHNRNERRGESYPSRAYGDGRELAVPTTFIMIRTLNTGAGTDYTDNGLREISDA